MFGDSLEVFLEKLGGTSATLIKLSNVPNALPAGGGFVLSFFHLTLLCVKHRPGKSGPNGSHQFSTLRGTDKGGDVVGAVKERRHGGMGCSRHACFPGEGCSA